MVAEHHGANKQAVDSMIGNFAKLINKQFKGPTRCSFLDFYFFVLDSSGAALHDLSAKKK